ncbi:hypothetical protein CUMW_266970, partial [Citrus unshiu]
VDGYVKIFPKVSHGWTVRYNAEDKSAAKFAEEAHQNMLEWFAKFALFILANPVFGLGELISDAFYQQRKLADKVASKLDSMSQFLTSFIGDPKCRWRETPTGMDKRSWSGRLQLGLWASGWGEERRYWILLKDEITK